MPDLGFNCRAERDKWRAGGIVHTTPLLVDVGPGSYDVTSRDLVADGRPGYAPFLSTAERKFGANTASDLPGPGHYATDSGHLNKTPLTGRPSDVFRSETRRFKALGQGVNDTPGPGTYLSHEEFGSKEQGVGGMGKAESDRIKWVRVPTAPSIPGREQSYGYEEGDQGELVMQRPVDLGHSGRGDDRPGPVDYQPRVDFTRRSAACIDFSKGEDRLVALNKARASTTPGPGHYNATKGLGDPDEGLDVGRAIRRKRQRPTASFHYGTSRDRPRKAQELAPGPGDYRVPSGLDVRRDPGRRDLSFLSTSRRFDAPATGGGSRAPGPGSYVTAKSDFDRCRAANSSLHRGGRQSRTSCTAPVGFHSTTLRFAGDSRNRNDLGPASYNVSGMAEELDRKASGNGRKAGAFGSTSKRFPVRGGSQPNLPGPGAYEIGVGSSSDPDERECMRSSTPTGLGGKRLPSALSAFTSVTKRFAPTSSSEPGPAPGQYETRPLEKPRGVLPIGKQSKNRFEKLKTALSSGLGPGTYNVRDVEQLGKARSRKNIMVSSQARFTYPGTAKTDNPGPGHYGSGMVYGNLLKQTYNIAIAEQSADIY